jgi:hypothetical protein
MYLTILTKKINVLDELDKLNKPVTNVVNKRKKMN